MERRIEFYPSYDKRDPDPSKNYGVHGVDIRFYVIGDKGAVQYAMSTGWLVPSALDLPDESLDWNNWHRYSDMLHIKLGRLGYPMPNDLGYHSKVPRYEDQPRLECQVLEQGYCYYDGSSLNAYAVYDKLIREGHEGVFLYLEEYYKELFENDE
jgi:hypothetical protein